jgi:hypothetical protein
MSGPADTEPRGIEGDNPYPQRSNKGARRPPARRISSRFDEAGVVRSWRSPLVGSRRIGDVERQRQEERRIRRAGCEVWMIALRTEL